MVKGRPDWSNVLQAMYGTEYVNLACSLEGRLLVEMLSQLNIEADEAEAQTWDAVLESLMNNLNRIRYMIVQITNEAWGTVTNPLTDYTLLSAFNDHKARHQNDGDDELSVAGLSGLLADEQNAGKIKAKSVDAPLAADDKKFVQYDHANEKYIHSEPAVIPPGAIILWSGAIADIPDGWVLCDGTSGAPDLTDRFVIHADADAAGTRNVGDTGGEHTHTLTIAEMPAHTHTLQAATGDGGYTRGVKDATSDEGLPFDVINPAGGGNAHPIINKFYALAYIMKT